MALHQVATINAACLALQALEAKGAPTQNPDSEPVRDP
jgi:hypothetical protein